MNIAFICYQNSYGMSEYFMQTDQTSVCTVTSKDVQEHTQSLKATVTISTPIMMYQLQSRWHCQQSDACSSGIIAMKGEIH